MTQVYHTRVEAHVAYDAMSFATPYERIMAQYLCPERYPDRCSFYPPPPPPPRARFDFRTEVCGFLVRHFSPALEEILPLRDGGSGDTAVEEDATVSGQGENEHDEIPVSAKSSNSSGLIPGCLHMSGKFRRCRAIAGAVRIQIYGSAM